MFSSRSEELIKKLNLFPHPEGGYYREVYRSSETLLKASLPSRFSGDCAFSTSIYFLLPGDKFSAFHRIKSDEIWHFYEGSSLTIYVINEQGVLDKYILGNDLMKGELFQVVVPFNCWFAAQTNNLDGYSLVGCTVSPGFNFADFELAENDKLISLFPQHESIIKKFI